MWSHHEMWFIEMRILFHFKYIFVMEAATLANTHSTSYTIFCSNLNPREFCVCITFDFVWAIRHTQKANYTRALMKNVARQYSAIQLINNDFSGSNAPYPGNPVGLRVMCDIHIILCTSLSVRIRAFNSRRLEMEHPTAALFVAASGKCQANSFCTLSAPFRCKSRFRVLLKRPKKKRQSRWRHRNRRNTHTHTRHECGKNGRRAAKKREME